MSDKIYNQADKARLPRLNKMLITIKTLCFDVVTSGKDNAKSTNQHSPTYEVQLYQLVFTSVSYLLNEKL